MVVLPGDSRREIEPIDHVTQHAMFLVLEVDHAPFLGAVTRDGEDSFTWGGGRRSERGREREGEEVGMGEGEGGGGGGGGGR